MTGKLSREVIEKLLILVRDNPGLYDPAASEYKGQQWTRNCWQRIAEKMNIDGISGPVWKEKWKNQRDTYIRQQRKMIHKKHLSAVKPTRKGPYYHLLTFLDPHLVEGSIVNSHANFEDAENYRDSEAENGSISVSEVFASEISNDFSNESAEDDTTRYCSVPEQKPNMDFGPASSPPPSPSEKKPKMDFGPASSPLPSPSTSSVSVPEQNTHSPVPQITKRQYCKRKATSKVDIDAVLADMQERSNAKAEQIDHVASLLLASTKRTESEEEDFYMMMSRKMSKLSKDTQEWMQDQVWGLWIQARIMEGNKQIPSMSQSSMMPAPLPVAGVYNMPAYQSQTQTQSLQPSTAAVTTATTTTSSATTASYIVTVNE